jgi:hypothetical protein
MNALERMRQLAREEEERKNTQTKTKYKGDGASFPIGEIPDNSMTTLRFAPDGDTENPWFWKERQVCKLIFDGQVGGEYETDEAVEVTVPCMDMFVAPKNNVSACPIIQGTKHLWKDENDTAKIELARQYYKKRSYLFQGFVVNTLVEEDELPENPIRRFTLYPSIFKIIKGVITDTEIEDSPTDYLLGRDFRLKKDKKPSDKWANYTASSWSTKVRPLSEEENIAIQQHGLFNLSDFTGTQPDAEGVAVIKAMFDDSLAGKPFDFESYGSFYRAFKVRGERRVDADAISHVAQTERVERAVTRPAVAEEVEADEKPASVSSGKPNSADILSKLKERQQKKA